MDKSKYIVSSTPHIRSGDSMENIMKDVLIALAPAALAGVYFFGLRALMLIVLSVASSMAFEGLYQKLTKQAITISDYSAAVTGLLLAMNLPPSAPFWIPIVGSLFAIVLVKQLFGGVGQNFVNPALAARAFLVASYAKEMGTWTAPVMNPFGMDLISTATPLGMLAGGSTELPSLMNLLIGNVGGCLGETSAIALLLGGCYLLYKKIINWRIPGTYLLSVFVLSYIFGRNGIFTGVPVYEIFAGGLILGAVYMATDYTTSPVTPTGQIIMGVGCGLLTVLIRVYGGYAEGVSYSILLMNLTVPLIDRYTRPRVFGTNKGKGAKANA